MKNSSTIINVVFGVAIATLFYLHFNSKAPALNHSANTNNQDGSFKVAYFEIDSIENHYEYYKEVRNYVRNKEQNMANQLNELKNAYFKKVKEYQEKGNTMSQAEQGAAQQDLMRMEEAYKSKEQMLGQELQDESFRKLQDVKKKIEEFLAAYNKDKGYAYILAAQPDLMYLKDTAYNITGDLIKGLNANYKKKP